MLIRNIQEMWRTARRLSNAAWRTVGTMHTESKRDKAMHALCNALFVAQDRATEELYRHLQIVSNQSLQAAPMARLRSSATARVAVVSVLIVVMRSPLRQSSDDTMQAHSRSYVPRSSDRGDRSKSRDCPNGRSNGLD